MGDTRPLSLRLSELAQAYPEDVFPPLTDAERKEHSVLVSRAAAAMGRHFAGIFREASALAARVEAAPVVYVYHYGDILRTTPPPPGMEDFVQARVALVPVEVGDG